MMAFQCRKCGDITSIGVFISNSNSNPRCQKCNVEMGEIDGLMGDVNMTNYGVVKTGITDFKVGGNVDNKGTFKSYNSNVEIKGNLTNEGKFLVNDPEKIKDILLEIAKSTKDVTEIGKMVCGKIFGWK